MSICYVILVLVSSCPLLWLLSLNWLSMLIAFNKKGNTVPMQAGLKVFGLAKTNYIIANHACTRQFTFSIVPNSGRRQSSFDILDLAWPVWSVCEMRCFWYITGINIIYSAHKHDFKSPWLYDLLYFDYFD